MLTLEYFLEKTKQKNMQFLRTAHSPQGTVHGQITYVKAKDALRYVKLNLVSKNTPDQICVINTTRRRIFKRSSVSLISNSRRMTKNDQQLSNISELTLKEMHRSL